MIDRYIEIFLFLLSLSLYSVFHVGSGPFSTCLGFIFTGYRKSFNETRCLVP